MAKKSTPRKPAQSKNPPTLQQRLARSPKIRKLTAERDEFAELVYAGGLRRQITQLSTLAGVAGADWVESQVGLKLRRQERQHAMRESIEMPGRYLTPDYFAREAGWAADVGWGMSANPEDRYKGANAPVFRSEADLRQIRAIGRFYTEFDEVGLGLRDNVVNYNAGEAITYVAEPLNDQGQAVADALQPWIDGFITQNRWQGLREKEPMRVAFSDGEALLLLHVLEDLEYPDIQIQDCGHLCDPRDMSSAQSDRMGYPSLDWEFGVGTEPGRQDRPLGYFFDWYGQNDYQLLPASRVVHVKLNVPEDVKRGVCDPFVAHTSLRRASMGLAETAKQAAIQATIAYIEKLAKDAPIEKVNAAIGTPGTVSEMVRFALGGSATVNTQSYMGGKVIRTNDTDFAYGPVGTPAGSKLVEVFNAVLRRVAVRWQFSDWMVTGDPSNNNMASSVVAETPFHRSTRTRQGVWADYYEQLLKKAIELAIAVGRGPQGVPSDPKVLWKLVQLRAKMPDPKERDQLEETSIREIQHRNRVLSVKTWREQEGLDHETEEANFEEEDAAGLERMEAETAATGGFDDPQAGADPTVATRQAVLQKRANKAKLKAKATESLQAPAMFREAAKNAGWDDQTRREVAAGVLYDRADDI